MFRFVESNGRERGQFTGQNSACTIITKTFDEKMFLNSSWYLTLSSITFVLYNDPTLNNYFHFCKWIKKLIDNPMEKRLFKLTEWSNITFLMRSFKDKNIQNKQVVYNSDQYVTILAGKLQFFSYIESWISDCSTFKIYNYKIVF